MSSLGFPFGFLLAFALFACQSVAAEKEPEESLAGLWQLRIDAGGEIYKGKFQLAYRDGKLGGTYESDEGRRTRISEISRKNDLLRIEARTQRFSVPVTAIFIADVRDGKMQGEVDFSTGTNSSSYDFTATAVHSSEKPTAPNADREQAKEAMLTASVSADRTDTAAKRPPSGIVHFQQGTDDYSGTVDVEVWAIAPNKPLEKQGTLTSDGNNGGGESQVLMRFDKIFGSKTGQVPRFARIKSAKLKVVAFDPGTTVYIHRIFVPWSAAATWDGLAAGLSIDNVEASTVRDGFTFGQISMDRQSVEFDVTQTVQHWADGEENFGWVFINTGSNGWDFYSADWHEQDLRPKLTIEFESRSVQKSLASVEISLEPDQESN